MKRLFLVAAICLILISSVVFLWNISGRQADSTNQLVQPLAELDGFRDILTPVITEPPTIPELTLDTIFSPDHTWRASIDPTQLVTIIATGDVLTARTVNHKMVTSGNFRWPFEKTADVLASADLTLINLETTILKDCKATIVGMSFCGDPRAVEGLLYAGVDLATLGNNHTGNFGESGIVETKQILTDSGITPVIDEPTYKTVNDTRFAFLSYNDVGASEPGVPWADRDDIAQAITSARQQADIVVVSYHWGDEYVTLPNTRQRELAYYTIDQGADLIIGNHPHWIQPVELYKGKLISYAHGNFVFDQEWSKETKLGVVGRYIFYGKKLIDVEFLPVKIVDFGQPYFLGGPEPQNIIKSMHDASSRIRK